MSKILLLRYISFFLLMGAVCWSHSSIAQTKSDTIRIDGKNLNISALKPSVNRYLMYFKYGKDAVRSGVQLWTRTISYADYNGKQAIVVTQEWEEKDSVRHRVKSVCDKETFAPLYHESWWLSKSYPSGEFDFVNKSASINGAPISDADTAGNRKWPWVAFKTAFSQYVLNWHLDLEVFPILPYAEGKTFIIPFYDPGQMPPRNEAYSVTGSALLEAYDKQMIDCWLLLHETKGNKEIYWVSKKTKEVLKMEQEINGKIFRYKIKLGFSI